MRSTHNIVPSHNSGTTNLGVKSRLRLFGGAATNVYRVERFSFRVVMDHMILSK